MVAQLFLADYNKMTANGVVFSPEEIIRLNALAVKVKLSPGTFGVAHLRRVVWLAGKKKLTLMEPTLAHSLWLERVGEYVDYQRNRNFRVFYSFALSRLDARRLPDPLRRREHLIRKVFRWAEDHIGPLTSSELGDALDYVLLGSSWLADERGPAAPRKERKDVPQSDDKPSHVVGVILNGLARKLPISLADALTMTESQMLEAIVRLKIYDHTFDPEAARNGALGEYIRARNAIAARANPSSTSSTNPTTNPSSSSPLAATTPPSTSTATQPPPTNP